MQLKTDWDPSNHPAYLLGRAARLFSRAADDRLAKLGVSSAHVPVIRILSDGTARSQAELAAQVKVEQPTMAALLVRMERDELIKRAPNPDDGRSSLFSLTPRAQSKVRAVRDVLVKGSEEMFEGFSSAQIAMLASLLEQAIENLEAAAAAGDDKPVKRAKRSA